MLKFSNLIEIIIVGAIIATIGYGIYRFFKCLQEWQIIENKRQKDIQESLANISDRNLATVVSYLNERQYHSGVIIFVLFLFLLIKK